MSVSTYCRTYFVDTSDFVTGNSTDVATCDSSLVDCTITTPEGNSVDLTCNSKLQYLDDSTTEYFCVCGKHKLAVPSIVNCAGYCYDLSTRFRCDWLEIYNGAVEGNGDITISDTCYTLECGKAGKICTSDQYTAYKCDNLEHDLPGPDPSDTYVCNCLGPAKIPSFYQTPGGKKVGGACSKARAAPRALPDPAMTTQSVLDIADSARRGGTNTDADGKEVVLTSPKSNRGNQVSVRKPLLWLSIVLFLRFAI